MAKIPEERKGVCRVGEPSEPTHEYTPPPPCQDCEPRQRAVMREEERRKGQTIAEQGYRTDEKQESYVVL